MKTIHLIAAARPNFMKIAPLFHSLSRVKWATPEIVHTGQHYDHNMSGSFFTQLGLPHPHHHLGVGSGTHAEQVAKVLMAYERLLIDEKPDLVVVVGDVNSTIACALAAVKLHIPVAHVEAGLRSFDRTMPEEVNRLLTDSIADLLFTPSPDGDNNLLREGVLQDKIHLVGNVMIDALELMRPQFERSSIMKRFTVEPQGFALATFHRPANVDIQEKLREIMAILSKVSQSLPVIFPVHPRTGRGLDELQRSGGIQLSEKLILCDPLEYTDFMKLTQSARFVLTDSGGIQEETTHFGVPCLTYRDNTERPVTIEHGTNRLVNSSNVLEAVVATLSASMPAPAQIPLWDGKSAERICDVLQTYFGVRC